MSACPVRFICPHCHTPIDPEHMETAINGNTEYRICPECDEAIVVGRSELSTASGELISGDDTDGLPPERVPIQPTEACHS